MTADLTEAVQRCESCQQSKPALSKSPWWRIQFQNFRLLLVIALSAMVNIIWFSSTFSIEEVNHQARWSTEASVRFHGIPLTLISNNGPNYASEEFSLFAKAWDFQHLTYSPKAIGKAESAVKIMKTIITKGNGKGENKWKAILEWKNSPTPSQGTSPAQRLMSRRRRSLYKPEVQSTVAAQVMMKRKLAKCYQPLMPNHYPVFSLENQYELKCTPNDFTVIGKSMVFWGRLPLEVT